MSLKSNISDEFKRSPVATIGTVVAIVLGALGLVMALIQNRGNPPSPPVAASPAIAELLPGNVFLVVGYFLAVTLAAVLILRAVARKHDIAAFFGSIPLVALTNFSVILVVYLAPPRPLSPQLFTSAHDLVFYSSAAVVIAFFGSGVLREIAMPSSLIAAKSETQPTRGGADGLGVLLIALIVLALWSWLVFAGQTRLARTLLPEIAHPVEVKPTKSGT